MTTSALRVLYDRFFALGGPPPDDVARPWRYRRPITSIGWPAAQLLDALVRERRPGRILDLGSGLTSHVLRAAAAPIGADVWTTDLSLGWLSRTEAELGRDGLPTTHCRLQCLFEHSADAATPFELVVVDLGDTKIRRTMAPELARWLAPEGIMVLDDWHMADYRVTMTPRLEAEGLTVTPRPDTTDEFGRYVALAAWRTTDGVA